MEPAEPATTPALTLLVDTNIVLDVILRREPWAANAARIIDAIATGRARGWIASHAVTTVHYIVARERDRGTAAIAVADLLLTLPVVPLGTADMQRALAVGIADYEDAVHAAAALAVGADFVVTRNEKDFRAGPVPPRSPAEVLALL